MSSTDRTTATINGNVVDVRRGDTILAAATRAGIEIPTLCAGDGMEAEGGCRMCLVEIDGQRVQAACHTPISPGMNVRTATPHPLDIHRGLYLQRLIDTAAAQL